MNRGLNLPSLKIPMARRYYSSKRDDNYYLGLLNLIRKDVFFSDFPIDFTSGRNKIFLITRGTY